MAERGSEDPSTTIRLHKKYAAVRWLHLVSLLWRVVAGSAVMGAVVWVLERLLNPLSGMAQLEELFLCVGAGFVVYVISLYALHVPEMNNLASVLPTRATDHDTTL